MIQRGGLRFTSVHKNPALEYLGGIMTYRNSTQGFVRLRGYERSNGERGGEIEVFNVRAI